MEDVVRRGIGVSAGVAIGPALVLARRLSPVPKFNLKPGKVGPELKRLDDAVARVQGELAAIESKADEELGAGIAHIIDAQRMMLGDASFLEPIRRRIREGGQNAEWAVKSVGEDLSQRFSRISDDYLRERGNDVDDLTSRLLRTLSGEEPFRLDELGEPVVLFAYDLSPADTAMLDRDKVLGFATDVGGRTSHTAIMARSMEIPAAVGLRHVTELVENGDTVILDGHEGVVVLHPTEAVLGEYRNKRVSYAEYEEDLKRTRELSSVTPDGHEILLRANIETPDEARAALDQGARGIGLYRSEFVYLRGVGLPDEEDHYHEYRSILELMDPDPVVIRTLDLGGEKEHPGLGMQKETNALLGLRGIRHSLREKGMFQTQLRGLLRASVHGNLRIVFPFVTGVEEVREAKRLIGEVRQDLIAEGHAVAEEIPLGAMLEIPASALIVDHLAEEVDFFSIGTNDLIQYLLAVDRNNEQVADLYEPLHPAVLRLLGQMMDEARERDVPVLLCGEAASDPMSAMMLIGFGMSELSMTPSSIPVIKGMVRNLPLEEMRRILERALQMRTAQEVEEFALERLMAHFPDGFMMRGGGTSEPEPTL